MTESTENNVFLALFKYAHRQGENFTTAAFVHLLRHLLDNEPRAAAGLFRKLTKDWLQLEAVATAEVQIVSQKRTAKGEQPDMQIIAPTGRNAIIEVKLGAGLRLNQLDYSQDANTTLVFLTRYPLEFGLEVEGPPQIRWHQVTDWLKDAGKIVEHETSSYLLNQFKDFLAGMGVTMEPVDESFFTGVQSLGNFMAMLREAVVAVGGTNLAKSIDNIEVGFAFKWKERVYFTGIYFEQPHVLRLQIDGNKSTIDPTRAVDHGFTMVRNGRNCTRQLDLKEVTGFLNPSKDDQVRVIEEFLAKVLEGSTQFTSPK